MHDKIMCNHIARGMLDSSIFNIKPENEYSLCQAVLENDMFHILVVSFSCHPKLLARVVIDLGIS